MNPIKAEQIAWKVLQTLWRSRLIVAIITGITAIGAVIISLLLPVWFMAEARLVLPSSSDTGSLLNSLRIRIPVASSPLGGIIGDYQRHLTILTSRTLKESTVSEFDLVTVYDLEDADFPEYRAIQLLSENVDFVVDQEFNHLNVRAFDRDPQRAADIVNFMVSELNHINAQLVSQNAGALREKIEQRYADMVANLDSINLVLRDLQSRYGVMDITTQREAFLTGVSDLRMNLLVTEAQYEQALEIYGPNNSVVRSAKGALSSLERSYQEALDGAEALLPVPKDSLPEVALQFWNLETERLILGEVLVATRPVLEEARLDEARQIEAVEILDPAVPPLEKARPARAIICVASTLSGFILSIAFVLVLGWWRENHASISRKMQEVAQS